MKQTLCGLAFTAAVIATTTASAVAQVVCPPVISINGGVRMNFPTGAIGEIIFPTENSQGTITLETIDSIDGHRHIATHPIDRPTKEVTAGRVDLQKINGQYVMTQGVFKETVGYVQTAPQHSYGFISRRPEGDPTGFFFFYNGQDNSVNCVDDSVSVPQYNADEDPVKIIECGIGAGEVFNQCAEIEEELQRCRDTRTLLETEITSLRERLAKCEADRDALIQENERLKLQLNNITSERELVTRDIRRAMKRVRWAVKVKGQLPRSNRDAARDFSAGMLRIDRILGSRIVTTPQ